jgi:uncharacterized protein YdhG (YjbR/CyaY superfamily)
VPAKAPATVDEFVERKVQPEFRGIVAEIRALMRKHAPKAAEAISYGLPMYAEGHPIAWISPSKTGISLGFRQGGYFEDKYGLLKNASKHSKNIKMKTVKDVNKAALRYYIKQAVELDKK